MSKQQVGILGGLAAAVVLVFGGLGMMVCWAILPPAPGATESPTPPAPTLEPTEEQLLPTDTPVRPTFTATQAPPRPTPTSARVEARVTYITDGDTIEVELGGETWAVRYIGIDCPDAGEPGCHEATEANTKLVEGQTVQLERDVSETDQYGRLLRYVYVGELLVNAELIQLGYAKAVTLPPDVTYAQEFLEYEQEARRNGLGLWASPTPVPLTPTPTSRPISPSHSPEPPTATPIPPTPTLVPAQPADVVVNPGCCQFDAPGNDNYNKEQEWVCFTNSGGQAADVTGWCLRDEHGWGYTFPQFTLAAAATVRVRTGCGANSAIDLYWCKDGTAVWNNDGDTVFLFDAGGDPVAQYSY